jgi:hypothetical protein
VSPIAPAALNTRTRSEVARALRELAASPLRLDPEHATISLAAYYYRMTTAS